MVRMKNTKNTSQVDRAFTLLELLVVISIIAILAGLVMPMFYSAKERAREAKAKIEVKALETAFKSYLDTYKVWPDTVLDGTVYEVKDDAIKLFSMLSGNSAAGTLNPQNIAFYEFGSTNALVAYDPWANPDPSVPASERDKHVYRVMFDKDYDNKISVGGQDVYRCVVVWSPGNQADVEEYGGGDDVASWK